MKPDSHIQDFNGQTALDRAKDYLDKHTTRHELIERLQSAIDLLQKADNAGASPSETGLLPVNQLDANVLPVLPLETSNITERAEIDRFCAHFGSDVKAADNEGETLLHRAIRYGSTDVVKYLISQVTRFSLLKNVPVSV